MQNRTKNLQLAAACSTRSSQTARVEWPPDLVKPLCSSQSSQKPFCFWSCNDNSYCLVLTKQPSYLSKHYIIHSTSSCTLRSWVTHLTDLHYHGNIITHFVKTKSRNDLHDHYLIPITKRPLIHLCIFAYSWVVRRYELDFF